VSTFHSELWSVLGAKTSRDVLLVWRLAVQAIRVAGMFLQRVVPSGNV